MYSCKRIHVVTSFNKEGRELYGNRFIETYNKYIKNALGWPLFVYSDNALYLKSDDYLRFSAKADEMLSTLSIEDQKNYRWQAKRFSHKVFSLYHHYIYNYKDYDCVLWFDADVEFVCTPLFTDIARILPNNRQVTYLRRDNWPHSEGGFIGIGADNTLFMSTWYRFYTTGALFKLREWHDVMAMDAAMDLSMVSKLNIATNTKIKHVWPESPLATFSVHHKGPGRKIEAYGNEIGGAIVTDKDTFSINSSVVADPLLGMYVDE